MVEFEDLSADTKIVFYEGIANLGGIITELPPPESMHADLLPLQFAEDSLLNFAGLWRLSNGGYARLTSFNNETKMWDALLFDETGAYSGNVFYDQFGNAEDGNEFLRLEEKKRGEEKGWPDV